MFYKTSPKLKFKPASEPAFFEIVLGSSSKKYFVGVPFLE